jgi:TolB-like protein/tetratricopeptide (TPR) repeat protein
MVVATPHDASALPSAPTAESARDQLEKVLASTAFRNSEKASRFLRFVAEHTLDWESDRLKEYLVGVDVFGRQSSYDPRLDPVVRLEARRVRARLVQYYATDGLQDAIRIEIPKGGYSVVFNSVAAPVTPSPETSPGNALARLGAPRSGGSGGQWWSPDHARRYVTVLLGLAIAAAAAGVCSRYFRPPHAPIEPRSMAVLPFSNLTGSSDNEWLSDGLTDDLATSLAKLPGVRVVARGSAFKFKGATPDARTIGKRLNAKFLLEGSVQSSGGQFNVSARFIRSDDGRTIWAETFSSQSQNPFGVEKNISEAVGAALGIETLAEADGPSGHHVPDRRAHEFYLLGRYWWNRRTAADEWKAIDYFNQALKQDPLYPQAYLGLADAYAVLGVNEQAPARDVYPRARAAAQQALALDGTLSEAQATLAEVTYFYDWDFAGAEREIKRAIELSPNYASAHQWYGLMLMCERRFRDATREMEVAQQLDPLSLIMAVDLEQIYAFSGQEGAAIEQGRKTLAYDASYAPAHEVLGHAYLSQGSYGEALEEFREFAALSGDDSNALPDLGVVYAYSGQRKAALGVLHELETQRTGFALAYHVAAVYVALGNEQDAYNQLAAAITERSPSCLLLRVDPAFNPLRSEPRFRSMLDLIFKS